MSPIIAAFIGFIMALAVGMLMILTVEWIRGR